MDSPHTNTTKQAAAPAWLSGALRRTGAIAPYVGAGHLGSAYWDAYQHPESSGWSSLLGPLSSEVRSTRERWMMGLLNTLLAGGGALGLRKSVSPAGFHPGYATAGITSFALAPTKDLAMRAFPFMSKLENSFGSMASSMNSGSGSDSGSGSQQWLGPLAAALITGGALGGGAYALQKAVRDKADAPINITTQEGGRLKVRLPTKSPDDAETIVDLPYDPEEQLSDALRRRIAIDTKRRLRAETQHRVRRIGTSLDQNVI